MKKCTALLLALLVALSLTACGQPDVVDTPDWEFPAAFTGLEPLVEQAQAEGSLTVYGGCPADCLAAVCETFETLFNVRVTYQQLTDKEVLEKLDRSGQPGADVWFGADSAALHEATFMDGLTAYTPAAAANLSNDAFAGRDGLWYGVAVDPLGLIYNASSLRQMGISAPADWEDLTKLEYWDLLWLPDYSTIEGWLLARAAMDVFDEGAEDFLLSLDENTVCYVADDDPAANYVGTGECVIAVGLLSNGAAQRLDGGYDDIRMTLPSSGAPYILSGAAILRNATHSAAAQLWMEFVLSPACQELMAKNGWYVWPTVSGVQLSEDFAQLRVNLNDLSVRLPVGQEGGELDYLIDSVQSALYSPAEG